MDKVEVVQKLVRPGIALLVVFTGCLLAAFERIQPERFWDAVLVVITFYFVERATRKGFERARNNNNHQTPPPGE